MSPVGQSHGALHIHGGTLLDGTGSDPVPGTDVLIRGDEIVAVGAGGTLDVPPDARTIDATGATVMPGLIDAHCHITFDDVQSNDELFFHRSPSTAAMVTLFNVRKLLLAGVTSMMDPDTFAGIGPEVRDVVESGAFAGPRIRTGVQAPLTAVGWTARRLSLMLGGLAGITLVAGLWIAVLRRQVQRQTAALRHRIESEAALEERQRIAREFHDTLEQELAGVTLRLDALATRITDDKGKGLVAATRNLVSRIQVETRELIADLRDAAETSGDLMAALNLVAARHSSDGDLQVRLTATTPIPPLPAATVHDLRMIARESINNARKHGRATYVTIEVANSSDHLMLRIVDNGCGFDATTATAGKSGHFGCAGIRERGRKIGAEVTWASALQKGTTVTVTLSLEPTLASSLPAAAASATSIAGKLTSSADA